MAPNSIPNLSSRLMKPMFLFSSFAIALFSTAHAQQNSLSQANEVRAENCMVKIINNVNVPAEVEGKLMELRFEEGATVAKGDVLAIIDDTQAKLGVELKKAEEKEALLNATNEVNLTDAINNEKLASAEAEAFKELRREGAIPFWELEKKRLEATRAKLRIDLAEQQMQIAKVQFKAKETEREMAEYELQKRKVTAPFDGFIETRIAQPGGWVQAGTPVATLIQLDRLRIEGDIDIRRYPEIVRRGTPVKVLIFPEINRANEFNRDRAIEVEGTVDFVSSEIDLSSGYRIWVEIPNQQQNGEWQIKPGMRGEIVISH